jgi:hypothetical protein
MGRAADPMGSGTALQVRPATREDAHGLSDLLGVLGYPCPPEEAAQRVMALRHDPEQTLLVAADGTTGKLVGVAGRRRPQQRRGGTVHGRPHLSACRTPRRSCRGRAACLAPAAA